MGEDTDMRGRVDVCISQRWGSLCGDDWFVEEIAVVCKQLGYYFDSGM